MPSAKVSMVGPNEVCMALRRFDVSDCIWSPDVSESSSPRSVSLRRDLSRLATDCGPASGIDGGRSSASRASFSDRSLVTVSSVDILAVERFTSVSAPRAPRFSLHSVHFWD
jgi:hypothetical protein